MEEVKSKDIEKREFECRDISQKEHFWHFWILKISTQRSGSGIFQLNSHPPLNTAVSLEPLIEELKLVIEDKYRFENLAETKNLLGNLDLSQVRSNEKTYAKRAPCWAPKIREIVLSHFKWNLGASRIWLIYKLLDGIQSWSNLFLFRRNLSKKHWTAPKHSVWYTVVFLLLRCISA